MKKLLKIGLILFGIGLVFGIGTYLYVFHKPHRNIEKEKPAYVVEAKNLYNEFSQDEFVSYEKYGNKVVQIKGQVVDVAINNNNASITFLDEFEGINCSFDSAGLSRNYDLISGIGIGDEVELKGQCDGYDMIMGVVLTRCVLLSK